MDSTGDFDLDLDFAEAIGEPFREPDGDLDPFLDPEGDLDPFLDPEGDLESLLDPTGDLEPFLEPEGDLELFLEPVGDFLTSAAASTDTLLDRERDTLFLEPERDLDRESL